MKSIDLLGTIRTTTGKNGAASLRKQGIVPCNLYGSKENVNFQVTEKELEPVVFTPNVYMVNLGIGSNGVKAIVQDIQFHPVSDKVMHVDFLQVDESKRVIVSLPVKVSGNSTGVREGGKLAIEKRKLKVKGFVKDLPAEIEIDITTLGLGKSFRVGEVIIPNVEVLESKSIPVVSVRMTRASREAAKEESKK